MSLKISYFNARGYTEPIRWILAHAGIEFEDVRVPLETLPPVVPPEIKAKCRWGQLPLAEFDGKRLCQSLAVTRYFARKYNLVPSDLYEAALCDEYVDSIRDFMHAWWSVSTETDEVKKKEKTKETLETTRSKFLVVFESIVKANGGKHLVGNSLTWADLYVAHVLNHVELEVGDGLQLLTEFPELRNLCENVVSSSPGIKKWIENRPLTKY